MMRRYLIGLGLVLLLAVAPALSAELDEDTQVQLVDSFVQAAYEGDIDTLHQLVDWEQMVQRGVREIALKPVTRRQFIAGLLQTSKQPHGLLGSIAAAIQAGGSLTPLHLHEVGGEPRAMLRLTGETGLNYLDMILGRNAAGEPRFVDFNNAATGELVSQSVRTAVIPLAVEQSKGLLQKLVSGEGDYVKSMNKLVKLNAAAAAGNTKEVLAIRAELPPSVANLKTVLLQVLAVTMEADEKAYVATMEEFRKLYPDSSAVDLISIDYFMLKGRHAESLASIDRVDTQVGGDPYLDVIRASVMFDQGDLTRARSTIEQAVTNDDSMMDAHWTLITVTMAQEDYDATAAALIHLEQVFEMEFHDLSEVPEYAGFVKSDAYKGWLQRHSKP